MKDMEERKGKYLPELIVVDSGVDNDCHPLVVSVQKFVNNSTKLLASVNKSSESPS